MSSWASLAAGAAKKPAPKAPAPRKVPAPKKASPKQQTSQVAGKAIPNRVDEETVIPAKIPRPPRSWRRQQRLIAAANAQKESGKSRSSSSTSSSTTASGTAFPTDILGQICRYVSFEKSILLTITCKDTMANMFSIIRSIEFPIHNRNKPQEAYPRGAANLLRKLTRADASSQSLVTVLRPAHYASDTQFEAILKSCPQLKQLHLRDTRLLSRETLVKCLRSLAPRLTSLVVTGRCSLKPEDYVELLPRMKQLRELRLSFPRHLKFSNFSLAGLVKLCRLELRNCFFFGDTVLLDESCHTLEELRLVQYHGTSGLTELIGQVSRTCAGHLRILHLADSGAHVDDEVLEKISPDLAAGLRVLNLDNARRHISLSAFSALARHLRNLEVLHFKNAYYLNNLDNFLGHISKVKTLVLTDFSGFERIDTKQQARALSVLTEVEYLDISYGHFTASVPHEILKLPKLRHLIMLTPQGMPPMKKAEQIIPKHITFVTHRNPHEKYVLPQATLVKIKRRRMASAKVRYYLSTKSKKKPQQPGAWNKKK